VDLCKKVLGGSGKLLTLPTADPVDNDDDNDSLITGETERLEVAID